MEALLIEAIAALEAALPYVDYRGEGAHPAWRTLHELRAELRRRQS